MLFFLKGNQHFSSDCGSAEIVSSTSYGCPGGPYRSGSSWCGTFLASNILSLDVDRWSGKMGDPANYWLTESGKTGEEQGFIMYLGCSKTVKGVSLRNTQNGNYDDRSTKKFRILGSNNYSGPWQELFIANIEDSRHQKLPPIQHLMFSNSALVSFIKFELLDFWGRGCGPECGGGGLQYFGVI